MAKLGSYYGLCPLIDSKSLLGIAEDVAKGHVIVTLGKNIASIYKLSGQKQICSWRTKEKFSSLVLYNKNNSKYLSVFNQSYLKMWNSEEENLDKLKKYKFNKQIYTLIPDNDETFILFQNGSIYALEQALKERKTLNPEDIISDVEEVEEVLYKRQNDNFYVGLIVKSNEYSLYWTECGSITGRYFKIELYRENVHLKGSVFHPQENAMNLLTIWSDGRIVSYPLKTDDESLDMGELYAVVESVSTKYNISMLSLDENYVAMYGANSNEEGAMLVVYNTQFKVTQLRLPFKLFTNGAKLWSVESNLLLPVGQNLAVVPYCLESEQIAALVGSHRSILNNDEDCTFVQQFEVASWDNKINLSDMAIPGISGLTISELLTQGLPETIVFEELLPDILKKHNIDSLSECIDYFSDIPEKYLAKLLKFLIDVDSKFLKNKELHLSKLYPSNLQPIGRTELIDKILSKTFSENLLVPHLRSELVLNDVLLLIDYICFMWSEDGHSLPSMNAVTTDTKLMDWAQVLIDSSYQKVFLCRDESVTEKLIQFKDTIQKQMDYLKDLKAMESLILQFRNANKLNKGVNVVNSRYSVEQISLY